MEQKTKINIITRTTEEDALGLKDGIERIVGMLGGIVNTKMTRMCDGCNKKIEIGAKYKGTEMNYCQGCSTKLKIKGKFKVNEY